MPRGIVVIVLLLILVVGGAIFLSRSAHEVPQSVIETNVTANVAAQ